jgi:hypothetical protein
MASLDRNASLLSRLGVSIEVTPPSDSEPRRAIRVDGESERALAQLIHWESGELDLTIGDAVSGQVLLDKHVESASVADVSDAIRIIVDLLGVGAK